MDNQRNPWLNVHDESEQGLVLDLIEESITIHGEKFFYIPKTLVAPDEILGEDRLAKYEKAYPIVAYMENSSGFEGQGAFIQRFGGMIDYSATLTISRRQWEEWVGQYGRTILPNRPCEGDLIYYPLTDSLFEIKYVDDKNPFAQLNAFYTYKITVELFQYSSEQINTSYDEIDDFESLKTFDQNPEHSVWGGVESVQIINGGKGYIEPPQIEITSYAGRDAILIPTLDENGSITDVEIVEAGSLYITGDRVIVRGECTEPADIQVTIKTQIENAGDMWGSNGAYDKLAKEETFDPENPFGGL